MARLEACYFCGTAEDDPLREVTVTPRRRQDDPDAALTLTLCRSCEGKLERVLAGLFEHVESRRTDEESDGAAEPEAELAEDDEGPTEPVDRIDVSSSRTDDATRSEGRRELFSDRAEPAEEETDQADDEDSNATDEPDDEDAEILGEEPSVTARATVNSGEALDGISVAEYNRVMRLLQNREFPMDRDEFVDLAANAYDLTEETVQGVLDAVIDQGALAEREGELDRPDGEGSP